MGKTDDLSERIFIRLGKKYEIGNGKYFKCSKTVYLYAYSNLKNIRNPIGDKIELIEVSKEDELTIKR